MVVAVGHVSATAGAVDSDELVGGVPPQRRRPTERVGAQDRVAYRVVGGGDGVAQGIGGSDLLVAGRPGIGGGPAIGTSNGDGVARRVAADQLDPPVGQSRRAEPVCPVVGEARRRTGRGGRDRQQASVSRVPEGRFDAGRVHGADDPARVVAFADPALPGGVGAGDHPADRVTRVGGLSTGGVGHDRHQPCCIVVVGAPTAGWILDGDEQPLIVGVGRARDVIVHVLRDRVEVASGVVGVLDEAAVRSRHGRDATCVIVRPRGRAPQRVEGTAPVSVGVVGVGRRAPERIGDGRAADRAQVERASPRGLGDRCRCLGDAGDVPDVQRDGEDLRNVNRDLPARSPCHSHKAILSTPWDT